jgi:hypothetical protein
MSLVRSAQPIPCGSARFRDGRDGLSRRRCRGVDQGVPAASVGTATTRAWSLAVAVLARGPRRGEARRDVREPARSSELLRGQPLDDEPPAGSSEVHRVADATAGDRSAMRRCGNGRTIAMLGCAMETWALPAHDAPASTRDAPTTSDKPHFVRSPGLAGRSDSRQESVASDPGADAARAPKMPIDPSLRPSIVSAAGPQ